MIAKIAKNAEIEKQRAKTNANAESTAKLATDSRRWAQRGRAATQIQHPPRRHRATELHGEQRVSGKTKSKANQKLRTAEDTEELLKITRRMKIDENLREKTRFLPLALQME